MVHMGMTRNLYIFSLHSFVSMALLLTAMFYLLLSLLLQYVEPKGALSISSLCSAFSSNPAMTGMINLQSAHTHAHSHTKALLSP